MNQKEKAILYPYDINSAPFLRYRNFIEDYNIINAVSPPGFGLDGFDASYADYGANIGVKVNSNFESSLLDCDTVIFTLPVVPIGFRKLLLPKITTAINSGKNISCLFDIETDIKEEISNACKENGVSFKCTPITNNGKYIGDRELQRKKLHEFDVPIIAVFGATEMTQKFEIQLSLRKHFMDMGYKVSQVGTRHYCELFGFHSFPSFMFDSISEEDKIYMFNSYIKKIELSESPDIVILGIPGGILPTNDYLTNRFSILPYEISHAVQPDATVCSMMYENRSYSYYEFFASLVKQKLGFDIDCFNLSNTFIDNEKLKDEGFYTLILKPDVVRKRILDYQGSASPIFNILDSQDSSKMASFIIEKLVSYT